MHTLRSIRFELRRESTNKNTLWCGLPNPCTASRNRKRKDAAGPATGSLLIRQQAVAEVHVPNTCWIHHPYAGRFVLSARAIRSKCLSAQILRSCTQNEVESSHSYIMEPIVPLPRGNKNSTQITSFLKIIWTQAAHYLPTTFNINNSANNPSHFKNNVGKVQLQELYSGRKTSMGTTK